MVLINSESYLSNRLTGVFGLCMGFATVAEAPRLVIKLRVIPGKGCNPAVPQHEKVVLTFAWLLAVELSGVLAPSSWHDFLALQGRHHFLLSS
jgi:hypothetical protein